MYAIKEGNLKKVAILFAFAVMICSTMESQEVEVKKLIPFGQLNQNTIKDIIDSGVNPNIIGKEKESLLGRAVELSGYSNNIAEDKAAVDAIKYLIDKGARLQSVDDAILFWPVANNKAEIVEMLMKLGSNPNDWNRLTNTCVSIRTYVI